MNRITQKHGPFRLTAGQHIEDAPIGAVAKVVKPIHEGSVVLEVEGKPHKVPADANGAMLDWHGTQVAAYRERQGRPGSFAKVPATQLHEGDEIELCREVMYGPPDADEEYKLKFPFMQFVPFFSKDDLTLLNKAGVPPKYLVDTGTAQANELEDLRRQVAELQERLAAKGENTQPTPAPHRPAPQSDPKQDANLRGQPQGGRQTAKV